MKITQKVSNFYSLENMLGPAALSTMETIADNGKEKRFMDMVEEFYPDGVDLVDLDDFIRFEWNYICYFLGIREKR